jgi:aspartyl-tRNA(Asn)/glutamyl-tRNA(Gln) amidotransferase subunit A
MRSTEALCYRSVHALSSDLERREISPVGLVRAYLGRIEELNPRLSAYLTVTADLALEDAKRAEAEIAAGRRRGPLHGIPFGVKDIFETAGVRTTHGSSFFPDFVPKQDAEAVRRLREAGAIMLGKTLTHEFAAATTTINPHYGTAHNPWDVERITGGSSGGSAAAVAAGLCAFALGSDTGGSIRNPAALCGVVGLKPTHGRVSLVGVCPNVATFDHVGPITSSARDAALVLQVLAGHDPRDAMSRDVAVPDYTAGWAQAVSGRRFVVCPDFYANAEIDSEVHQAFEQAVQVFRSVGAKVDEVSFRSGKRLTELFPAISGPEFAEFHRPFFEKNPDGYGASVRERLDWSFKISSDEYVRALRERELLRREVSEFFRTADALLLPSMPCVASPIATLLASVNGKQLPCMWIHRPFQSPHNLTGCPAISLPMGFNHEGLPLPLQIVTPEWQEARALAIADAYEQATPELRARRPPC